LYINGILKKEKKDYNTVPSSLSIDLNIGWNFQLYWWRNTYWIIDDIKIYNRALSDSEIKQQAKAIGF
jgi:hypothetical protein